MDDNPPEYVLYLRKSKGRAGIAKQRTTTTAHVAKLGGRIVAEFPDSDRTAYARDGVQPQREKFDAMLAYLEAHPGTRVAAWHADRISRNDDDIRPLIKGGIWVETVRGGSYDLSTALGVKRLKGDVVDAEYEVAHLIERLGERIQEHREDGRWLGGHRPFGWQIDRAAVGEDGEPLKGVLVLDEAEAAAVAEAVRGVLAGRTTHAIAREWNGSGKLTSFWRHWKPAEVRRVLTRDLNWAPPPAQWPPLVSADEHRAVCAILADRGRRTTPGPEVTHLLSGIARCGMCWAPMNCGSTVRKAAGGNLIYRCRNQEVSKEDGGHVARAVPSLDAYVELVIIERFKRPDAQGLLLRSAASDLPRLETDRAALGVAMKASNDLRRQGLLTDEEFADERRDHQAKALRLDAQIDAARRADLLAPMVRDPEATWEAADIGQKRAIIRELFEVVVIPQGRGRPKGWKPGQPYLNPDTIVFGWKRHSALA